MLRTKKKGSNRNPWFTESCRDLRNTVKNYEKLVNKYPQNTEYRHKFYSSRTKFRRLCKFEGKKYKEKKCSELSNISNKNPKAFWDILNNFNRLKGENSKTEEILPQEDFVKFYKNLNSGDKDHNSVQKQIIEEFVSLKNNFNMSEVIGDLNNEISNDEIIEAIRSIRKTASTDLISNEMLKNAVPILIKPLQNLFNLIFKNGTFPKILVLLHKKGNKFDPGNYRGISISSNLGKLFNKVCLLTFMNNKNLRSKNQIGFKEKSRTADHIFTLKTIIDQYKQKSKKVFTAFVDLKKAFDTIWRLALFYKLLKDNIPHRIFNIIHSMYTDTICRIKFSNGLSAPFSSERVQCIQTPYAE